MQITRLQKAWQVLLALTLFFAGIYFAKPILAPLAFALLFSLLLMPMCRKLESWGLHRALAITLCILTFLAVISGIIFLITWQVKDLASDLGNVEYRLKSAFEDIKDYIAEHFSISKSKQDQILKSTENPASWVASLGLSFFSTFLDFILMLVYVFMMMFYRNHIRNFILKIIPRREKGNAEEAIATIEKVSQHYIMGMGMMIASLWIMYSIGFSILGLKNAIFFAILCGLLELAPFVGNLVGNILAATMALTQGGGLSMVVGVLIVYSLVQLIQSYILQPLVVGNEVNINPLFTIVGLVVGELLWGISGMVLILPILAIAKIICDHIEELKPYGFLLGNPPTKHSKLRNKMDDIGRKKRSRSK